MAQIIVGGVVEKEGKFLLVQEAQEKCRGKWNIPAGHLDPNETIFEGTKREIKEETGCNVELTGVLQVGNWVRTDEAFISVVFATKLVSENIKYDPNEILDVKWFTYDELLNMKDELRNYIWIINSVKALIENKIVDIDLVKMM